MFIGPPLVRTYTMLKSDRVKIVENRITTASTGIRQRQGDVPKARDGAGAIRLRRLVELARDCYQTGEQRDRKEGQAAPDVDQDHRKHREVGIGQPRDVVVDDVQTLQRPIHDTVERVEHPPPNQCAERGGHNER